MGASSDRRREQPVGDAPAAARPTPARATPGAPPAALQRTLGNQAVLGRLGRADRGGLPLDAGTRRRMEGVLRQDFSRVRVHTGAAGAALAGRLSARAVTMGDDIAFAPGQYQPGTPVGDAILAHELAHVVQQRGAAEEPAAPAAVESSKSPLEREAEGAAAGAVAALWAADRPGAHAFAERARPTLRSRRRFQRCGYTVEKAPHKFNSCGFSASGGGALSFRSTAATATLDSPGYDASGEVGISGGTDAQAQDWEAGFLQTDLASRIEDEYGNKDSTGKYTRVGAEVWILPGPTRDGDKGIMPWYEIKDVRAFPKTDSTVKPSMHDAPESHNDWQKNGGTLAKTSGYDRFASWLIVRQKSTKNHLFLNWATWEVDWAAEYDAAARTGKGKGKGMRVTDTGDGQGAHAPQLGDPVANDAQQVAWIP